MLRERQANSWRWKRSARPLIKRLEVILDVWYIKGAVIQAIVWCSELFRINIYAVYPEDSLQVCA